MNWFKHSFSILLTGCIIASGGNIKAKEAKSKELQQAQALLDSTQLEKAESILAKVIKENPSDQAATLMYGITLYRQSRYHAAAQILEKLSSADVSKTDVWLYLARTYQKGKRLAKAISAYETFLKKVPEDFKDRDKYGTLLMILKQQLKKENAEIKKNTEKGNYIGDVTESGIYRWSDSRIPIKVFINEGKGVPGYRYQFDESIRDAFYQWELKTKGLIKFKLLDNPKDADLTVTWSNDLHSAPLKAEMGHAKLQCDGEGIKRADIELLTVNPFEDGPVGARLIRNVCLHEVGHALGLQGHSPYKDDIMYPQLSLQDGISGRDLNTLTALYSKDSQEQIINAKPTIRQHTKARQAAILSNLGSKQAMAGNFSKAYETLTEAIKIDRSQKIVRHNLAAVTNNLAIKQDDPKEAVKLLHESLYWEDKDNTQRNLAIYLKQIKVNPESFEDRVKLSKSCLQSEDLYGAVVEMREALKLKDDADLAKDLKKIENKLENNQ